MCVCVCVSVRHKLHHSEDDIAELQQNRLPCQRLSWQQNVSDDTHMCDVGLPFMPIYGDPRCHQYYAHNAHIWAYCSHKSIWPDQTLEIHT